MRSIIISFLVIFLTFSLHSCRKSGPFDIVIKGGTVLDGSGSQAVRADIGIRDGKITAIGNLKNSNSSRMIDATDLIVSPGFIDSHTHIESIMKFPGAQNHIRQGVTTVVGGIDGGGPWPFGKYLDSLDLHYELGPNVAYLTGHNTIRNRVMGNENRHPTPEELDTMKAMTRRAMEEGAFGLSTGLKYIPGAFSGTPEVIGLSKVASGLGGFYHSHLREEGLGLIEAVNEAIIIGRDANIPVVMTHHKAIGKPMWGKSLITTGLVDSARNAGIDVMMDQYPYTASSTGLSVLIPSWAMAGSSSDFKKRLANPVMRDSILAGIKFNILNDRGGGDTRLIQFGTVPSDSTLNGKTLYDYAVRSGVKPDPENSAKLVLELQLKGGASCIYHAMWEEDVERIMKHPYTMIASDGGESVPHPRSYGTFPRVLGHYVREKNILTLEEAIRKMTSLPARRLGLTDRGLIKEGNYADITIFDPKSIIDRSTFGQWRNYPDGIYYVIVNGVVTFENGEMTNNRAGKVLRGPAFH